MGDVFDHRIANIIGEEDVWLTPDEVSRITGFKIGTLATWRSRRKGPPATIIGRSARYSSRQLKVWMKQQANFRAGASHA
jgi:Helix-turn-helix domain